MKKIHFVYMAVFIFSVLWILFIDPSEAVSRKKISPSINSIPGEVTVVLRRSCIKCHDTSGNETAMSKWVFSKWDTLTPTEQARLAKLMCKVLTTESMPPMSIKMADPELTPTLAEIDIVCNWSNTYK